MIISVSTGSTCFVSLADGPSIWTLVSTGESANLGVSASVGELSIWEVSEERSGRSVSVGVCLSE